MNTKEKQKAIPIKGATQTIYDICVSESNLIRENMLVPIDCNVLSTIGEMMLNR